MDFSQQQLVDCSWDYGNNACDGGVQEWAWEYLVDTGGAALLSGYEYASQDRFCKAANATPVTTVRVCGCGWMQQHMVKWWVTYLAVVSNWCCLVHALVCIMILHSCVHVGTGSTQNMWALGVLKTTMLMVPCTFASLTAAHLTCPQGYVSIPEGDLQGIRRAVYTQGPLAVSIDASQPGFRYYSSGVYYDPNCLWKEDELDHAVTLVGYGDDGGEGFWEIRNSWSKYWGDGGYIKISQRGHACGVTTNAAYTVVGGAAAQE